jgi:hypothetical protein
MFSVVSQASKPVGSVGRVAFELDRFELIGGDHLEVEGRWFGVRGRRFMRPALSMVVDGSPTRLLADLAGKPWPAEDGRPWNATFPFVLPRGDLLDAELTVAPDITVTLPAPAEQRTAGRAKSRAALAKRARPAVARDDGELRQLQRDLSHVEIERAQAAARIDGLLGELSRVGREREEAEAARDRLAADLDSAREERDRVAAERESAREERDRVAAERDAARRERDEAVQASDAARVDRDRAQAARGGAIGAQRQAESERDAAIAARNQAAAERDGAIALRDHALAERDAAVAARDEAMYRRDALSATTERLQSELADAASTRGAAMVMRRALQQPATSRRYLPVLPAAIGIIIALTIAVLLLIVLRGF